MVNLYIVGAGGFGREVYCWLQDVPVAERNWTFAGFLDDDPDALAEMNYAKGVVGAITGHIPKSSDLLVCGIGAVTAKRSLCQPLIAKGAQFLTLVHASAIVGANVKLGAGVVICPGVVLTCDIEVGEMAMINCNSTVGHDARVGAWCTISAHCDLTGHTYLGAGAFMGSGARIIPGKSVGAGCVVGAGSVVIRSIGEGKKVFGNPARVFG